MPVLFGSNSTPPVPYSSIYRAKLYQLQNHFPTSRIIITEDVRIFRVKLALLDIIRLDANTVNELYLEWLYISTKTILYHGKGEI